MKVIATKLGYYGNKRIREGHEFVLLPVAERDKDNGRVIKDKSGKPVIKVKAEDQFSSKWMMKLQDHQKMKAKNKPLEDEILGGDVEDLDVI